jgi:homoserine dehydrogenase
VGELLGDADLRGAASLGRREVKEIPIVLLGFGNVARALLRLLEEHEGYRSEGASLVLHSVFDRGGGVRGDGRAAADLIAAKRDGGTVGAIEGGKAIRLDEALEEIRGRGVLVDSSITNADTGGPGLAPARRSLERGMSVVFASKGPLVAAFEELASLARGSGARIGASAAVGIPLPSLEVGALGLRGAGIRRFRGILNDTTNQFFRDMEAGISLEDSIAKAREAGTIEEDPRLDLEGWDAAYKLLILARVLWSPALSLAEGGIRGVSALGKSSVEEARERGRRIRLIATAERSSTGEVSLRTEPEALDETDPFYALAPGEKAILFETGPMGSIMIRSSKGGPVATAACVVKDILNLGAPARPFFA